MARTILDEVLHFPPHLIEHQTCSRAFATPMVAAYNRTTHLPERRQMMQQWADYLDGLKTTAEADSRSRRPLQRGHGPVQSLLRGN